MNTKTGICLSLTFVGLAVVSLLTGWSSTKVSDRHEVVTGPIPKPPMILVYDFVATAGGVPNQSLLAAHPEVDTAAPQTPEQIAEGQKVGAELASELAAAICAMGMPAQEAKPGRVPTLNDIVLQGYILSIQQGSAGKLIDVGFGSGESELKTAVEGFQMTENGLRKLGGGQLDSGGSKAPGADMGVVSLIATHNPAGLIVSTGMHVYGEESGSSTVQGRVKSTVAEIAAVLKKRFQEQGWIQ
jgi:hypothetical protein